MKTSTFLTALAASASLLAAVTSATAQVGETRRSQSAEVVGFCDGFDQEAAFSNTENDVKSTASPGFVTMPSTLIDGGGSGGTTDLYTVTLSGEALISGGGNYQVQAQVSIDGGPFINMSPNQPSVFHSNNLREVHTMTWCRQINASTTDFRIVWRKNFGGTAFIDNYLMRVERSD